MTCELLACCQFFNDKMKNMPTAEEYIKKRLCFGDYASCNRFRIYKELGSENILRDFDPDYEEVKKIIQCQRKNNSIAPYSCIQRINNMFKIIVLSFALTLVSVSAVLAANYIEPQELKMLMDKKNEIILVDIQPATDFEKQHLPGSIETNAFPASKDEEKARLDKALTTIKASMAPVIVVCPRGKTGAKNSYNYLESKGVSEERMLILEDGIAGWPYKELFVKGR